MNLVRVLFTLLFPERPSETVVADATYESISALVESEQLEGSIVSLLPYRADLVKACVLEAKFHDSKRASLILGRVLADYVRELQNDMNEFEEREIVLVPVPLSQRRLKERGFNQAERIAQGARIFYEQIRIESDLLKRVRDTLPQTSLSGRARKRNVEDAFEIRGILNPNHTYIVLDDVATTGATLHAARIALASVGTGRVLGLSLAH